MLTPAETKLLEATQSLKNLLEELRKALCDASQKIALDIDKNVKELTNLESNLTIKKVV